MCVGGLHSELLRARRHALSGVWCNDGGGINLAGPKPLLRLCGLGGSVCSTNVRVRGVRLLRISAHSVPPPRPRTCGGASLAATGWSPSAPQHCCLLCGRPQVGRRRRLGERALPLNAGHQAASRRQRRAGEGAAVLYAVTVGGAWHHTASSELAFTRRGAACRRRPPAPARRSGRHFGAVQPAVVGRTPGPCCAACWAEQVPATGLERPPERRR